MSAQSQQIKQNFLNHPYTQQANKFVSGQVNALDAEVRPRLPVMC
jgi:receptor expression-enhancing protein 5/6